MPDEHAMNTASVPTDGPAIWRRRFRDLVPFVIIVGGIVTALYFGQSVLKPLALAILITVLLNAASDRMTRISIGGRHLPRWMGLAIAAVITVVAVIVFAQILAGQIEQLNANWPRYLTRMEAIAERLAAALGADIAGKVTEYVSTLDVSSGLSVVLGTTGSVLADLGMVFLYVAFLIPARGSSIRKLSALFPAEKEHLAVTQLLTSISESTRKYMLIKTAMSVMTGLASYAVMKFMGLDFAATWAVLIFLLNYIPTIGSIFGVIFPSLLALVQFDSLGTIVAIIAMLGGIQFVIGNLIEPIYMGKTLNLSSVVVILSLAFWGALWGIFGMLLSVPLTVMLMIFCAHVPPLRWIAVILSEDGKVGSAAA